MQKQFLIVAIEDEVDLLELIEFNLQKHGFDVVGFTDTKKVGEILEEENVSLLLVDRNLKGVEGSDFVQELRQKGIDVPVIFLSAKVQKDDVIEGFKKGGDDYITKPFSMDELILRINAILRRTNKEKHLINFKDISIDEPKKELLIAQKPVKISRLEFELLLILLKNKGRVLSREYLLDNVWNDTSMQEKTVNVAMKRLKEKIDPQKNKNYIKTIRGYGYLLC